MGGEVNERDFTGYMDNLGLPHSKSIDIAVPANLRCGRPEAAELLPEQPSWAPLTFTYAGVWEIEPMVLEERLQGVQVVDVREEGEFSEALGLIEGALLIPPSHVLTQTPLLSREQPIVTVCRSGARATQATVLLKKAGYSQVAIMAGECCAGEQRASGSGRY